MNSTIFLAVKRVAWIIFLSETVLCTAGKKILLKSVQHHAGNIKESSRLELGTMVLFFSEPVMPIVVHKKDVSGQKIEQRIMFPHVMLFDEQVKAMITRINEQSTDAYTIKFSVTHAPVQGLELFITYNRQEVLYNYETTLSSAALPGYVFRFINQTSYNDLVKKIKEKGVTHTAWQKKSLVL